MALDLQSIQLPPPGARLRLPPKTGRKLSYEEAYQQVRRQLQDTGSQAAMSVQMNSQVRAAHAQPLRTGASH